MCPTKEGKDDNVTWRFSSTESLIRYDKKLIKQVLNHMYSPGLFAGDTNITTDMTKKAFDNVVDEIIKKRYGERI